MTPGGIVTLGETMALLSSPGTGPLSHADTLRLSVAGSESNVAIGVSRLGGRATWIGRVGDDEFGRLVVRTLRGEGVDVVATVEDETATGLMLKERRLAGRTRVRYYRRGLAGSRLAPTDVDEGLVEQAMVLHVTGITPALSESAAAAIDHSIQVARKNDTLVSFDVNHREALWSTSDAASPLRNLAGRADVLFASEHEAQLLVGDGEPSMLAERLSELGPRYVLLKRGDVGVVAVLDGRAHQLEAVPVTEIDPVGAGDAFAAAFLSGLVAGEAPEAALQLGIMAGAFAVAVDGDWEGLPTAAELADFRQLRPDVSR